MWRFLAWSIFGIAVGFRNSRRVKKLITAELYTKSTFHFGKFHCSRFFVVVVVTSTMFVYAGLVVRFNNILDVMAFSIFANALIVHFFIDLDTHLLLHRVSVRSALTGFPLLAISAINQHDLSRFLGLFAGSFMMWVVLALLARVARGGIGQGDVMFAPLLGAFIGYISVVQVFVAFVTAFLVAGLWAICALATRRLSRNSQIAFGPFLAVGAQIAVFAGAPIVRWWLG